MAKQGPKSVNWAKIEREYIRSVNGISYKALAEKYGVHESTVNTHGRRADWVAKRETYHAEATRKALVESQEKLVSEAAQETIDAYHAAMTAARVALEALQDDALTFNSKDAASRSLIEALKFLEVLAGNPDSIQHQDIWVQHMSPDEKRTRLKELVNALDLDGSGSEPTDGAGDGG